MILVEVAAIALDTKANQPVLILAPADSTRLLPIPLGQPEAMAILAALQHVDLPRPMTHDLMASLFEETDVELLEVRIVNYTGGIFYAELLVQTGGEVKTIDSRPSDAVALAVRLQAEIYVSEAIFNIASVEAESISVSEEGFGNLARPLFPNEIKHPLTSNKFPPFLNRVKEQVERQKTAENNAINADEAENLRAFIEFSTPEDFDF